MSIPSTDFLVTPSANTAASTAVGPALWLQDDRYTRLVTVMIWTLVVLMVVPDGLDYSALSASQSPTAGSAISRMLWLGLLALSAGLIVWRLSLSWLLLGHLNIFLLAFVGLAFASVVWSLEPTVSLRRAIRASTIVAVCVSSVLVGWQRQRFAQLLRPVLTFLLLGSLLFGLVLPDLAVHQISDGDLAGAWRGLCNHKNSLGMLAGIGVLLWAHAGLTQETAPLRALAGVTLAGLLLLLSHSSTSLVTTSFCLLFLFLLLGAPRAWRPYMPLLVTAFALIIITYAIAVLRLVPGLEFLLRPIAAITGKDLTFTGRSEIWLLMTPHIDEHPWLGGGYGAFWVGPVPSSPSYELLQRLYFYPGSAHNGYLEVVNDLGTAGLLCLVGYLSLLVIQSLRLLSQDRPQATLILVLILHQAITNFSESHWFNALSLGFVVISLATLTLARLRLEQRLRGAFGWPPADPLRIAAPRWVGPR